MVADALRLRFADSLNNSLSQRVDLLDKQSKALSDSYTNLLKIEREKFEKQKEITALFVKRGDSYRDELEGVKQREKKARGKNKLLGAAVVGLVVLLIAK